MKASDERVLARLDVSDLPVGEIVRTLQPLSDSERRFTETWDLPFSQWGGFSVRSDLFVDETADGKVLRFENTRSGAADRAIVHGGGWLRDCRVRAAVRPTGERSTPHVDNAFCNAARVGVVFRMATSRWYYEFAIEGRRRAVLYRRKDDEWLALAEQDVTLPDGFITLDAETDCDGIRCRCPELGVEFFSTDTVLPAGKAGFRSLGGSVLKSLEVTASPVQARRNARLAEAISADEEAAGANTPDAVLVKTIDLAELGGAPLFRDFAEPGRFDMLVPSADSLRAVTTDGEELWRLPEEVLQIEFSTNHTDHGRLIFGFAGKRKVVARTNVSGAPSGTTLQHEMIVIRGSDGEVLARRELPPEKGDMRFYDFSPGTARLQDPEGFDVVLREWRQDLGGGGRRLWAMDRNLNELWFHEQESAHYGHHYALAFHDIDGDGRDELLAGGEMYRGDGTMMWRHDMDDDMNSRDGAGHYDAVALGGFSGDPEVDPVAFLLGGSGGVYVVDAKTGRTRAVHRIGHAQGRTICNLRPDLPGKQILAVTRWGNYGIITMFTGEGERLWTIQPDYVGQGFIPLQWGGRELLWTNTSQHVQALYDGFGRKVQALAELSRVFGERPRNQVPPAVIRMGRDPQDYMTLSCEGKLHIFGPAS